ETTRHQGGGGGGGGGDDKRKRRHQAGAEEQGGGVGGGGGDGAGAGGGAGWRGLDPLSVGYYRRVGDRLTQGFEDEEERVMFVENVLAEVKGKAKLVAMDKTGSVTLQQLLPLASLDQVGAVLAELGAVEKEEEKKKKKKKEEEEEEESSAAVGFKAVSCDRCGGHVVESALRQMSRWTDSPEEESEAGVLETQVLALSDAVRREPADFIRHTHGSHAVRTLLHVLAGCVAPPRADTRTAKPGGPSPPAPPADYEAPVSFWYEFRSLSEVLMANVNVSVTDTLASVVFQVMLSLSHRKRPKLCR
ncbi:hypothetical protein CRUP_000033, partial [Coryphaenoides rupestris]